MKMSLLLATGLVLLAPAVANADSIVYIDQGNVWSAEPDGSHKVQLTTGGQWHSPTQADDGRIAAVQGTGPIQVMARDGQPLHTITTAPAKSGDGGTFAARPVQLSFSPDGTKIAYAYVANSCPVASTCGSTQRSVFYTSSTEFTPHSVYGNQHSVSNPEWVNNNRTLVFGGFGRQVAIDDLDAGDYNSRPWMVPNGDMGDGELTRDGTKLAVTTDYGANLKLTFFAVTEPEPAYPQFACEMTNPDPKFHDPSWAPDNAGIAYGSSKGIEVSRFTQFGPGLCAAPNDSILSPTGTEPDWGPAAPPASAYKAPPVPQTPAAGGGPGAAARAEGEHRAHQDDEEGAAQGARGEGHGARCRQGEARRDGQGQEAGERHRHGQAGRHGHREARQGAQERQDPHPQVDVQQRDDDVVSEGALTRRLRRNVRDLGREAGERDVDPLP